MRASATAVALCTVALAACGGAAAPASSAPPSSAAAPASGAASAKPAASASAASSAAKPAASSSAAKPAASGAAAAKPAASGAAAAKPAASPAASGLTPVLIGYPGVNMGDAQEWVATEGHIWEKHGLAADVRNIGSSAATVAALIDGSFLKSAVDRGLVQQ